MKINGRKKQKFYCDGEIISFNFVSQKLFQSGRESPVTRCSLFVRICFCCTFVYVLNHLIIPPTPWLQHTLGRDRQPWNHTVFILHTGLVELKLFEQQIFLQHRFSVFMDSGLPHLCTDGECKWEVSLCNCPTV